MMTMEKAALMTMEKAALMTMEKAALMTMEKAALMTMEETGMMIIMKLRWISFPVANSQRARVVIRQSWHCLQTCNRTLILPGIWVLHLHRLRISLLLLRTSREWIFPT